MSGLPAILCDLRTTNDHASLVPPRGRLTSPGKPFNLNALADVPEKGSGQSRPGVHVAIREIVKYGDPRLVAKNRTVEVFDDPGLATLLQDLKETCWAAPGLGLAAPQVGVNLRVAIVDLSVGKDPSQVLILVNP